MIKFITIASALFMVLFGFIWLILNFYLTIKLRKKKKHYIRDIVSSAPEKYRKTAKMLIDTNMSWLFASSAGHIWYSYVAFRFIWKIPKSEINQWHREIKRIFSSDYRLYQILNFLINIWFSCLIWVFIFVGMKELELY
ncbi:hypothetical protein [Marinomonas mediterranea]|uniref:hypothetical protein n=1 Tax=Marinomonas mediterranea TaxID=119864 RepID=UPI00234A5153|nr:hypothetical protein [Marinomonas mediterranea]WCN08918.1 hypothetical protein GV055_08285 [Marinomonas mediterranea]WCN12951.1 hypothetical protein GV054_08010 [Marinomonas mediterranea]